MKKMLLLIVSLLCVTIAMNAQDASGNCMLPGANDYVNVDFYKGDSKNRLLSTKSSGYERFWQQKTEQNQPLVATPQKQTTF